MPSAPKKLSRRHLLIGAAGEAMAAQYLKKEGYRLLEQNYRTPFGEIDIVARDGEVIVFIEVKSRSGTQFGSPQSAVDRRKQAKISQVALAYLKDNKIGEVSCRFDVVTVLKKERGFEIALIRNAFEGIEYA